jgi:hypothetical protein
MLGSDLLGVWAHPSRGGLGGIDYELFEEGR